MDERIPVFELNRGSGELLRGVAIFYVLLGHTGYIEWGGAAGVVLFLILSGFGIDQSCQKHGMERYWQKRLQRVWLPYIPIGLIGIMMKRVYNPGGIICTILGLDFNRIADKTMWFVSYVLFWYAAYCILTCILCKVRKGKLKSMTMLAGLLLFGFFIRWLYTKGIVWHENSCADNYFFCFPLGVALSELSRVRIQRSGRIILWAVFTFLCLTYVMRVYPRAAHVPTMAAMGLFPVFALQCIKIKGKTAFFFRWFGRYSYPIYLFEGLVLEKRMVWFAPLGAQVLIDLAFIVITTCISVLYWDGVFKPMLSLLGVQSRADHEA